MSRGASDLVDEQTELYLLDNGTMLVKQKLILSGISERDLVQ